MAKTKKNVKKPNNTSSELGSAGGAATGAAAGAAVGAAAGSVVGPLGAALGAVVGGIAGASAGERVKAHGKSKRKLAVFPKVKNAANKSVTKKRSAKPVTGKKTVSKRKK